MPRPAKPPRLYLRRDADGIRRWIIIDRGRQTRTGACEGNVAAAERALQRHIAARHAPQTGTTDPHQVTVGDVLAVYLAGPVGRTARPRETMASIGRINEFMGDAPVSGIRGALCRAFTAARGTDAGARRDLENLRAAIRHFAREHGLDVVPEFTMPPRARPRERWLTRGEAARLLAACRHPARRHLARFVLIALYTGTRHRAILALQWHPNTTGGWIDLEAGLIYRRGAGEAETKKRRPPARIPRRLKAHLERWRAADRGIRHVVHREGMAIGRIEKAFRSARAEAGLGPDVVIHTLRHTCGTWLAQAGVRTREAADYLGMTVAQFEAAYYHHHPDYQTEAAEAF